MKKKWMWAAVLVSAIALFAPGPAAGARPEESDLDLCLRGAVLIPGGGDFDVYDLAAGVEAQYRFWDGAPWGWALAAGVERWEAGGGSSDWAGTVDGAAYAFPIGVSGLAAFRATSGSSLTLEAGLRAVLVQSDLTLETSSGKRDVDLGPALIGLLAADWETPLAESIALSIGAGYQFDILKADAETDEAALQDAQWQAFFIRLGLTFEF